MATLYPSKEPARSVFPANRVFTEAEIASLLGGPVFYRVEPSDIFIYRQESYRLGLPQNVHQSGFPGLAWGDVLATSASELGFDLSGLDPDLVIF